MSSIDNTSDLQDVFTKIDKLKKLLDDGNMDYEVIRYLPGMTKISRQGQIYSVHLQRVCASPNWSDLRTFEFNKLLQQQILRIWIYVYLYNLRKARTLLTI